SPGDGSYSTSTGATFINVYDFYGYTGAASAPNANWTLDSTHFTGPNPKFTAPPDNTGLVNVVFKYTGPNVQSANFSIDLGAFTITSSIGAAATGTYAAQEYQDSNPPFGPYVVASNVGNLSVPVIPQQWNVDANGNWSLDSNWIASPGPNGVDAVALFG